MSEIRKLVSPEYLAALRKMHPRWAILCPECWRYRLRYRQSRIIRSPRRHG